MKNKLHFITIILMLAGTFAGWAQEIKKGEIEGDYYVVTDTIDDQIYKHYYSSKKAYLKAIDRKQKRVNVLNEKKRIYESNQRTELAEKIKQINDRVKENSSYTNEMAIRDKEGTAEIYAQKITAYNEYIEAQIRFEEKDANYTSIDDDQVKLFSSSAFEVNLQAANRDSKKYIRTTTGFTLGFGYNFIQGDNLGINDFSYPNNNHFTIGYNWKTAIDKKQKLRIIYGIEYQSIGTELNGNRAFTTENRNITQIERLSFNADKAKFRQDQLIVPIHLEFGGTERKEYEDGRVRYEEYNKWKIGLGGYAGFNTSSRLKLKGEIDGDDFKRKIVNEFDNNKFVYGLDAYIGKDDFTFFGRMGLNDIFNSGSVNGQYVSFGIRFQ